MVRRLLAETAPLEEPLPEITLSELEELWRETAIVRDFIDMAQGMSLPALRKFCEGNPRLPSIVLHWRNQMCRYADTVLAKVDLSLGVEG
jgi:hypothetical protein